MLTLTWAAAYTSRVGLGTSVLVLPMRHPLPLAKELATLQNLSDGRLILGAGVGWLEAEFAALGVPFRERGRRMDEGILMMRAVWGEDPVSFAAHDDPGGDRRHAHAAKAGKADPDLDRRHLGAGARARRCGSTAGTARAARPSRRRRSSRGCAPSAPTPASRSRCATAGTAATTGSCAPGSKAIDAVGVEHVLVEPAERELSDWLAAVERIARAGEGMLDEALDHDQILARPCRDRAWTSCWEAERLGFEAVWAGEAYGTDAVSPVAWVLARTSRIKAGTSIMQMPARTPACAAMTAMTLQALSGNRFLCGIGPSGPQVVEGWHGVPFGKPLARTREYVAIIRQVMEREGAARTPRRALRHPLYRAGLDRARQAAAQHPARRPGLKIYTASITPAGLRTAGEVADGTCRSSCRRKRPRPSSARSSKAGSAPEVAPTSPISTTRPMSGS